MYISFISIVIKIAAIIIFNHVVVVLVVSQNKILSTLPTICINPWNITSTFNVVGIFIVIK